MFLQRLQEVMEHHVRGISRITSHSARQVRFDGKAPSDCLNVIDGALIEQFLRLDDKLQAKIVSNMMLNSAEMCADYLYQVKTLVQALTQMH